MITQPYPSFIDPKVGGRAKPVSNGTIFIGEDKKDQIQFPEKVYYTDSKGTEIEMDQPIYLNQAGVTVSSKNSSTVVSPYTKSASYSILIVNSSENPVYTNNSVSGFANSDDITDAQNKIVNGFIFKGSSGDFVKDGDTVPAGTTHLQVLIDGNPKIVSFLPISSGAVSSISEKGATIGGNPVFFYSGDLSIDDFYLSLTGLDFTGADEESGLLKLIAENTQNKNVIFPQSGTMNLLGTVNFLKPKGVDFGNVEVNVNTDSGSYDGNAITIGDSTATELLTTTSVLTSGDTDLGVISGVNAGDWLCIYNPTDYSYSGFRPQYRQGEYVKVASNNSSVKVDGAIIDTYPTGCKIYKIAAKEGVKLTGKLKVNNLGDKATFNGLRVFGMFSLYIDGLSCLSDELTSSATFTRCGSVYGGSVDFQQASDTATSGLEYGAV